MGENSAIEWTGDTWNPTTGCTKVSPACAHCYIERTIPFRTKHRRFVRGHIPLQLHENRLSVPLRNRTPTVYFVNSLSDLFHDDVPVEFIARVFDVMACATVDCGKRHQHEDECWQGDPHTFQILTKRPERMRRVLTDELPDLLGNRWPGDSPCNVSMDVGQWPLPNVWLGVSVENQHFADERIPQLLETPAAVRFLSCEPLLGPLNLTGGSDPCRTWLRSGLTALRGALTDRWLPPLDWVIAGAESGPKPRPTNIEWARSLRDQCVAAGVPFFWKQNGGRTSKSGGRELDGRTWDQMPEARA
jgi:protein gp37